MTLEMMSESFAENLRGGEAYEWGHRAAFEYARGFEDKLAEAKAPITVINPGDELYDATKRAASYLQNAEFIDRPEWGHGLLDVFTEEVVTIVRDALAKR
jgi:hypothetical protein